MSALVIARPSYYTKCVASREQPIGVVAALDGAPLELVAGLPLAVRAMLELQHAGVEEVVLVVNDADAGAELAGDPRIDIRVHVRAGSIDDAAAGRDAIVVPSRMAAHRDVYRSLFARVQQRGGVLVMSENEDAGWVLHGDDAAEKRQIVDALFEGCRKPVDGIVSRHLNRHVSIFISKRIANVDISPNAITMFTFVLGVAAMLAAARATYLWLLVGAALLQLNSILDGVDGELARVRFQGSKLGQWLDTVCDDLANTMFYGGVAYAAWVTPTLPRYLAWCGAGAVVGSALTMTMYYAELARLGSGDFYALDVGQHVERTGWWGAVQRGARYVTKRDFFVFSFLVAAALGVLPYILPIMAAGTLATVVTGLRITLARLIPRAA